MRLQQHLNESMTTEAQDVWLLIMKKCRPFLREWLPIFTKSMSSDTFLWRGTNKWYSLYGEEKVRKDRISMNIDSELHKFIDDVMYKKFKIRGRTQSAFTTGRKQEAVGLYGDPYMIFPIGKYDILWSPEIKDLYMGYDDPPYDNSTTWDAPANKQAITDLVHRYKKGDLKGAIKSHKEVMVHTDSYIYVSEEIQHELTMAINDEIK